MHRDPLKQQVCVCACVCVVCVIFFDMNYTCNLNSVATSVMRLALTLLNPLNVTARFAGQGDSVFDLMDPQSADRLRSFVKTKLSYGVGRSSSAGQPSDVEGGVYGPITRFPGS
mgnify:CR=1 FL=1